MCWYLWLHVLCLSLSSDCDLISWTNSPLNTASPLQPYYHHLSSMRRLRRPYATLPFCGFFSEFFPWRMLDSILLNLVCSHPALCDPKTLIHVCSWGEPPVPSQQWWIMYGPKRSQKYKINLPRSQIWFTSQTINAYEPATGQCAHKARIIPI